jgi:hypothetical protein
MSKAKEQNHEEIPEGGIGLETAEGQADTGGETAAAGEIPEGGTGLENPGDPGASGDQGDPGNQGDPGTPENQDNLGDPGASAGRGDPGDGEKDETKKPSGLDTVEDHAERGALPASVFAAVMQAQNWAAGKRVPAEEFKQAVDAFLKAPMGGRKPPEGEKQ